MSTEITMQDLELETAELLPARETLCSWRSSSGTNITQSDGNVYQSGGGFLSPNIGNSSLHGKMIGFGYYWAISRSFDLIYQGLYYTQAGLVNNAELRGKLNQNSDFDLQIFNAIAQSNSLNEIGRAHV